MTRYNTSQGQLNRAELGIFGFKDCAYWLGAEWMRTKNEDYRDAFYDLEPTVESALKCYCTYKRGETAKELWRKLYSEARKSCHLTGRINVYEAMALALVTFED